MKKCSLMVLLFAVFALFLKCDERPAGPKIEEEIDKNLLFVPIQSIPAESGFYEVYLGCLKTALDAGRDGCKKPFARGPKWEKGAKLFTAADVWDEFYFVCETLAVGGDYTIGFGTCWGGSDNASAWLDQELIKDHYFYDPDPAVGIFHFTISPAGEVVPLK